MDTRHSIVLKYPFVVVDDEFTEKLPVGAKFLSVQVQRNIPCMWFQCHTIPINVKNYEERKFKVITTGRDQIMFNLNYLGTFQLLDGDFVGHLYEVVR